MSAIPAALPARSTRRIGREDQRRHIEIVSSRDQRRARPRLVAAIVTVGGLFAILAAQLLLTIATSEGAYEIAALQTTASELARDEQVLTEQLQVLDAPQHLAAEAQGMGMVASSSAAYLQLADGAVLGVPAAASAASALRTAADGTALIPNTLLTAVPLLGAATETQNAEAAAVAAAGAPGGIEPVGSVTSTVPAGIPSPITH